MFAAFLLKEFQFFVTASLIILGKNVERTAQNVLEKANLSLMTKQVTEKNRSLTTEAATRGVL